MSELDAATAECPACKGTGREIATEGDGDHEGAGYHEIEVPCRCGGGHGPLLVDVMRGGEWLTEELLDKPCPFDTVLMRFPRQQEGTP